MVPLYLQLLEGMLLDLFFALEMVAIASFLLIVDLRSIFVKSILFLPLLQMQLALSTLHPLRYLLVDSVEECAEIGVG